MIIAPSGSIGTGYEATRRSDSRGTQHWHQGRLSTSQFAVTSITNDCIKHYVITVSSCGISLFSLTGSAISCASCKTLAMLRIWLSVPLLQFYAFEESSFVALYAYDCTTSSNAPFFPRMSFRKQSQQDVQSTTIPRNIILQGRFDIVSLSGSFLLSENSGTRSRTGGLSVSLAGPDGCVIGGGVGGTLVAAGPVQVIVGSFVPNGKKVHGKPANPESVFGHSHSAASEHPGTKHGGVGSTLNPSTGPSAFNTVAQQSTQNTAMFQSMGRQYSHSMGEPWHTTNISISLPGG
eukprot:Gb_33643 [translate_table: standard]